MILMVHFPLQGLRHYSEAEQSYKQSLRIRKKQRDRNVVEVTTVMHNLASLNHLMQRHDEALKLYEKSLRLREKYLGHVNVEVASSLGSLAAVKVRFKPRTQTSSIFLYCINIYAIMRLDGLRYKQNSASHSRHVLDGADWCILGGLGFNNRKLLTFIYRQ